MLMYRAVFLLIVPCILDIGSSGRDPVPVLVLNDPVALRSYPVRTLMILQHRLSLNLTLGLSSNMHSCFVFLVSLETVCPVADT